MRRLGILATVLVCAAAAGHLSRPAAARPAQASCTSVSLSWGRKCIAAGQFCKISGDAEYHRFRYHCHTGRLSRSWAGGNATGAGCQAGYAPCLPRVADLNCADIPASKKPIRVSGADPYRLDGNGDGIACAP